MENKIKCSGNCKEHSDIVKKVYVFGWGYFNYCKNAIETDINKGLIVTE